MRNWLTYALFFFIAICKGQQTIVYSQYIFNKAGVNPAASGTDINQQYNYVFGINRQWVGFDHAPKQNFVNFSMTIRPPRSYHYWQNVGVYIDTEGSGVMTNNGAYANYTIHTLLRRNLIASFGVYAGIRAYYVSSGTVDKMDPIFKSNDYRAILYPDVIPGFRLSNKKFFMDLAVRQLSIYKLQDFKGNKIGSPSRLKPTIFFAYGRKIPLNDIFVLMPSVAINTSVFHIPDVSLNAMLYYVNRMGAGVNLRNTNFLGFIYQLRLVKNLAVGFCYSTSLNNAKYAAPHSFELMIGVTPSGLDMKTTGKHSIARCPALDF